MATTKTTTAPAALTKEQQYIYDSMKNATLEEIKVAVAKAEIIVGATKDDVYTSTVLSPQDGNRPATIAGAGIKEKEGDYTNSTPVSVFVGSKVEGVSENIQTSAKVTLKGVARRYTMAYFNDKTKLFMPRGKSAVNFQDNVVEIVQKAGKAVAETADADI